jgi:hypothetical protein
MSREMPLVLCLLLTQAPPLVPIEPVQAEPPLADRPLTALSRGQLRSELRKTERQRPLIGFPILQLGVGGAAALFGALGLGLAAGNPFGLSEGGVAAGGTVIALGVGAIVTAIWWLARLWPDKQRVEERMDAISDRMEELDEERRDAVPCCEWPVAAP